MSSLFEFGDTWYLKNFMHYNMFKTIALVVHVVLNYLFDGYFDIISCLARVFDRKRTRFCSVVTYVIVEGCLSNVLPLMLLSK